MPLDLRTEPDLQILSLLRRMLIAWDRKRMGEFVSMIEEARQWVAARTPKE